VTSASATQAVSTDPARSRINVTAMKVGEVSFAIKISITTAPTTSHAKMVAPALILTRMAPTIAPAQLGIRVPIASCSKTTVQSSLASTAEFVPLVH